MKKNCQLLTPFYVLSNLDRPNPYNYFKEEKFHSLSAIIKHFEIDASVSNIKKKNSESVFSFKKNHPWKSSESYLLFKHIRKSCETTDIPNKVIQLHFGYFSKVYIQKFIYKHYYIDKGEFRMKWDMLNLSQYLSKALNETTFSIIIAQGQNAS